MSSRHQCACSTRTTTAFRKRLAGRGDMTAAERAAPHEPEPFPWNVSHLLSRCGPPEPIPVGGVILRGALTEAQQKYLYELLFGMVDHESAEIKGLRSTATAAQMAEKNPDNRPQPFVTWVHPYTRASNARERPTQILDWAERLMHALVPASCGHVVDSMLAQMYAGGGSLLRHRDEDLSWGLGVSLGCAAEFDCLPDKGPDKGREELVTIRSGVSATAGTYHHLHAGAAHSDEPIQPSPPTLAAGHHRGRIRSDAARRTGSKRQRATVVVVSGYVWQQDPLCAATLLPVPSARPVAAGTSLLP